MTVEPLEGMDALFVTMDSPNAPLHMGIVLELEAKKKSSRDPIERFGEIKKTIDQRLGGLAPGPSCARDCSRTRSHRGQHHGAAT